MTHVTGVEITRYRVKSNLTTCCCLRNYQGCTDMSCTPSLGLLIDEIHQLLPLVRVFPPLPRATSPLVLSLHTYVDMNLYVPVSRYTHSSPGHARMSLTQGKMDSGKSEP